MISSMLLAGAAALGWRSAEASAFGCVAGPSATSRSSGAVGAGGIASRSSGAIISGGSGAGAAARAGAHAGAGGARARLRPPTHGGGAPVETGAATVEECRHDAVEIVIERGQHQRLLRLIEMGGGEAEAPVPGRVERQRELPQGITALRGRRRPGRPLPLRASHG